MVGALCKRPDWPESHTCKKKKNPTIKRTSYLSSSFYHPMEHRFATISCYALLSVIFYIFPPKLIILISVHNSLPRVFILFSIFLNMWVPEEGLCNEAVNWLSQCVLYLLLMSFLHLLIHYNVSSFPHECHILPHSETILLWVPHIWNHFMSATFVISETIDVLLISVNECLKLASIAVSLCFWFMQQQCWYNLSMALVLF